MASKNATPADGSDDELLSASQASRFLGYKNPNQVNAYLRIPGYFPEPDQVEPMGTAENPRRRLKWRRGTLREWKQNRPGPGKRAGSETKAAPELPPVPRDGDPDELLPTPAAASLLGYDSERSFRRARSAGNLPLLTDEASVEVRSAAGRKVKAWTRRLVLKQEEKRWSVTPHDGDPDKLLRRGTLRDWKENRPGPGNRADSGGETPELPPVPRDGDPDELLPTPAAASLLGYKGTRYFLRARRAGNLPLLTDEASVEVRSAAGQKMKAWPRHLVLEQEDKRWVIGPHDGDPDELLPAPAVAGLLGYKSEHSFGESRRQGNLPLLTDEASVEVRSAASRKVKAWPRHLVLEQIERRRRDQISPKHRRRTN
ncbi:hypothetical protein [Streptomyces sp. NPDC058595]|uniref:hypothetical protein n=1 Tax=Streptomyces sp. NPDC058595 TaxID=3346550 RepID=UPI003664CFE8